MELPFSSHLEFWEFMSYLVTVLGLPIAILAVWREMRAERLNEQKEIEQRDDEIYVELSQQYSGFLETVLAHPELNLMSSSHHQGGFTPQQEQMRMVYFEMLIALFERAFILLFEPGLEGTALRRWHSWVDYMRWWLAKPDFRHYMVGALDGEDPAFTDYMQGLLGELSGS